MDFSSFGRKLNSFSGILQLMDDLGRPLPENVIPRPLGGGNPARIPEVEAVYRRRMEEMLASGEFETVISQYDAPQGRISFIDAVVDYFRREYSWPISRENVAVMNGSQSAMFFLFNMLAGNGRTILFPLMPEYVGYADQGVEEGMFVSVPSVVEYIGEHEFKYHLDPPAVSRYLDEHPEVAAIAVSRPTNPSGNVLTDGEIDFLCREAERHSIPLIVDNAYGLPFPDIIFAEDAHPIWNRNMILSMSLSKIGLPAIRTGIIIADETVVAALSNINAIAALTAGSMGQAMAEPLIASGELVSLARQYVNPFYRAKSLKAKAAVERFFEGTDYYIHKCEGSIFLWLYLPRLSIPTVEFYRVLKDDGVVTVPGEYSFFGHEDQRRNLPYPHPHYDRCLRINYSGRDEDVEEGLRTIAERYRQYSSIDK